MLLITISQHFLYFPFIFLAFTFRYFHYIYQRGGCFLFRWFYSTLFSGRNNLYCSSSLCVHNKACICILVKDLHSRPLLRHLFMHQPVWRSRCNLHVCQSRTDVTHKKVTYLGAAPLIMPTLFIFQHYFFFRAPLFFLFYFVYTAVTPTSA